MMHSLLSSELLISSGLLAYVGPGPGLSMTWAVLGLIGTLATAFVALIAWPIRRLRRRLSQPRDTPR